MSGLHTTPASIAEHAETVASSARFRKAPVLRELLLYLVNHRDFEPNEYAIAVDALGRKPDFDPKVDATVRVQIARLRQRLKDYYDNEGRGDSARLIIPLGSYRIAIEASGSVPEVITPAPDSRRPLDSRWPLLAFGLMLPTLLALAWDDFRLRREAAARPVAPQGPKLDAFWKPLVSGSTPVTMVIPAPLFFSWQDKAFVARDYSVNDPAAFSSSAYLPKVAQIVGGEPAVSQLYTVASDTLAGAALTNYLHARGVGVQVLDTPTLTLDALSGRNSIVFVGPGAVRELEPLLKGTNFYVLTGSACVHNRRPRDGEPERWNDQTLAPGRVISYGIISRLPGSTPGTYMLILASRYNTGLSTVLTTPSELAEVEKLHRSKGAPEHFEMVVQFERNADRILRSRPITLREFTPAP